MYSIAISEYKMMPLGPPVVSAIMEMPVVPVEMMFLVAFLIVLHVGPFMSRKSWKVFLIPVPSALMMRLLPAARDVMVCPNSAPIPAITRMHMGIMAFLCWEMASRSVIEDIISLVFM